MIFVLFVETMIASIGRKIELVAESANTDLLVFVEKINK